MARQRGIIKLRGTIAGLSFINSKTYGAHVRAARGTHKEAKINDVLKANSENAVVITKIGSPVLQLLKTLEPGFSAGDLWPRMLRRMYKAKGRCIEDLLQSMKGIEVNERYSFAKLFTALPGLEFFKRKGRLVIEMEILSHARFSRNVKASEYLCELSVLFFNGKSVWVMDRMETNWISFDEAPGVYEMDFMIPRGGKYFLVVASVKGGRDKKEIESFGARGYFICDCGKC